MLPEEADPPPCFHFADSIALSELTSVERGSGAETAGLRGYSRIVNVGNYRLGIGGDLITAIEGKPVTEPDSVTRALARKRPGDILELTIYRSGRTMNIKVKLGEASDDPM